MGADSTAATPDAARRRRGVDLSRVGGLIHTTSGDWALSWAVAWRALVVSRVIVLVSGAIGVWAWGIAGQAATFDPEGQTFGFGRIEDGLTATLARWDSTWYLDIAQTGYTGGGSGISRTAFFPLYPLLVRGGGWVLGSDYVAAVLVSLVCLAGALVVFHRLVDLELGPDAARAATWLLALFPMSFFGSAIYSESLFLLLSVGALWCARTDRFAAAAGLAALAALTRSAGLVLLVPLVVLTVRASGPARLRASRLAALLAVPLGVGVYCLVLSWSSHLPARAPFDAQKDWLRISHGPLSAVWQGAVAAWDGARQLLSGSRSPVFFKSAGGDPFYVARINLMLFGFLLLAAGPLIGVLRRMRIEYGLYVLAALMLPLSYPVGPQPLMSLPRFEWVLFPLFAWAGGWVARRRWVAWGVYALSAVGLAAFAAQFATWHFVA